MAGIEMVGTPTSTAGSEIFSNDPNNPGARFYDQDTGGSRNTMKYARQVSQDAGHAVRRGTIRAMHSVGGFFGVTEQSQQRLQDRHGAEGFRTLRRRPGGPPVTSYVDTKFMTPEFLGEIDVPMEFLGFEDGAIPPGKEQLFIQDPADALAYYKQVADSKIEDGGFFGREGGVAPPSPTRKKVKSNKLLKSRSESIRDKLNVLPSFWPYFTIFVIALNVLATGVLLIVEFINPPGIAPVHLVPVSSTSPPNDFETLVTGQNKTVTYAGLSPNMWIGPSVEFLLIACAQFAPCMRRDQQIISRYARDEEIEEASGGLGCCQNMGSAGTVLRSECGGVYTRRTPCSNVSIPISVSIAFRPCCIGVMGMCRVVSMRECQFLGGSYHGNADTCRDVNCFFGICGMFGSGISSIEDFPNRAVPTQWWRWITALFFHAGIIHLIVVAAETLIVAGLVEHTAGFIRVMLIYFITGVGGNMFGSILSPYAIQLGASPAIMGLTAVFLVEYFETVQALENKCIELLRLLGVVIGVFIVNFFLGTFPYVDNWSNIGGFLFGIPSALIFLPYVTFGKWDAVRKRIVLAISIPLLLFMYLAILVIFYVANTDFCPGCKYFSCIPYVPGTCGNAYNYPDPNTVYSG